MVKFRDSHRFFKEGQFHFSDWLKEVEETFSDSADLAILSKACVLAQDKASSPSPLQVSCFLLGISTAEILYSLGLDVETIAAGILYPGFHYGKLSEAELSKHMGAEITGLILGLNKMQSLHVDPKVQQTENLRRLLLAVVEDLRVVLLSLANYTAEMHAVIHLDEKVRHRYAINAREIYAPLANRLGIGQIKWELEDLSFRFLEPQTYKQIANYLDEKRIDREEFIAKTVAELKEALRLQGINAEVTGRAKHIFSIWKKMLRKGVGYHEIYDIHAIRVLLETINDCYASLGVVHGLWRHIPKEFDDYIANPKANGYRSLHTAVVGPEAKMIEVQIRTLEMHKQSELGVAAHWRYKEGVAEDQHYEAKLAQLRQVLKWQEDWASDSSLDDILRAEVFHDRVYVLTPKGKVMDLTAGSTVLDFAYHIHSDIGNHCRGAKVNGRMVPLTHVIKNGDTVEVLTHKKGGPSRDWLNPHLGYLASARARSKVLQWFKHQDKDQHMVQGREDLERELHRLGLENINYETLAQKLKMPSVEEMFIGIGSGHLRVGHILNAIQSFAAPLHRKADLPEKETFVKKDSERKPRAAEIVVAGLGNVLCQIARCCKPVPGEEIVGYLALGRGVSVHKKDCPNIIRASERQLSRLVQVEWGEKTKNLYSVNIVIQAQDRQGLIRDISAILANEHVNVGAIKGRETKDHQRVSIILTVEISGLELLSKVLKRLQQIPSVISVKRE